MKRWTLAVLAAALATAAPAFANAPPGAMRVSEIVQQQREIRDEVQQSTGSYVKFDRAAKARIREAQERIFVLLENITTIDQLPPDQQVEVFNALEEIKRVITDNRGAQQQCWRERRTGSMLTETVCATVAERDAIREGARTWKADALICIPTLEPGSISCGRQAE